MESNNHEPQPWDPVPPGTLAGIARRHHHMARQRTFAIGAGLFILLAGLGVGLSEAYDWSRMKEYHYGGITCHEVHEAMPAYLAGTLPEDRARMVATHLRLCPNCSLEADSQSSAVPPTAIMPSSKIIPGPRSGENALMER